jgi:cytochrome c peroxidase
MSPLRRRAARLTCSIMLCALAAGCSASTDTPAAGPLPAPILARPNSVQSAVVGVPFAHDVTQNGATFTDVGGRGLIVTVTFDPAASGFTAANGRITGSASAPGFVTATVVATDQQGQIATDRFQIVVFGADLSAPITGDAFRYADGAAGVVAPPLGGGQGQAITSFDNMPTGNATTDAGAALGRVLFYDRRLSANDQLSCSSCHIQATGFADTARFSRGFLGGRTARHSMALGNARYWQRGTFFWDERAASLEAQVLMPIQDAVEMGLTLEQLETKLRVTPFYGPLFAAAFGTTEISRDRISRALAQFIRAMGTFQSPFDRAIAGPRPDFASLGPAAARGQALFTGRGCARCHTSNAQVSDASHNTGLDATITDVGAGNGRFKAPSLRNVGVRARFMHDGRFSTLEQVVAFYDQGVQNNPNLDPRLRRGAQPDRLNLSDTERRDLVAFLHTLTDSTFLRDPRFASPFVRR